MKSSIICCFIILYTILENVPSLIAQSITGDFNFELDFNKDSAGGPDSDDSPRREKPRYVTCSQRPSSCPKTRYRSYDGSCNNLNNPQWGTPLNPYAQFLPSNYPDGVNSWPKASDGGELPNAREISLKIFIPKVVVENKLSLITMQWGQIVTHDMSLTAGVGVTNQTPPICCDVNGQLASDANTNPLCRPILIPRDDDVHVAQGEQCMNFVRTSSSKDIGCTRPNEPANPLSIVTSYIDLSLTYGSSEREAMSLRERERGRLLTIVRNGFEWPQQVNNVRAQCSGALSEDEPCYHFGDFRGNQSPQLTALQIILVNDHNRKVDGLAKINPHWDDETLFQEARRICTATTQHIIYYEYLVTILGKKFMEDNKLIYSNNNKYVNDYNSKVNPAVTKEHASAAFRHLHSMIQGYLNLTKEDRGVTSSARLSDWFNRPLILERNNGYDDLIRGLASEPADKSDEYWTLETTRYLFRGNRNIGGDLRATDIQRGRDHGLPPYVDVLEYFGLLKAKSFKDLNKVMSKENVQKLELLYKTVKDVDLVVGGSLETNARGAQVGPTFRNIIAQQFYIARISDRFFYERGDDRNTAFTLPQLNSIRETTSMARLLCDNGHNIKWMQRNAFFWYQTRTH